MSQFIYSVILPFLSLRNYFCTCSIHTRAHTHIRTDTHAQTQIYFVAPQKPQFYAISLRECLQEQGRHPLGHWVTGRVTDGKFYLDDLLSLPRCAALPYFHQPI